MSMSSEVLKLVFAVLDVSFNSSHYTVSINDSFCTLITIQARLGRDPFVETGFRLVVSVSRLYFGPAHFPREHKK